MLLLGTKLCKRKHCLDVGHAQCSQSYVQLFLLPLDHYVGLHTAVSNDVHAYGVAEEKGFRWRNQMQIELRKLSRGFLLQNFFLYEKVNWVF